MTATERHQLCANFDNPVVANAVLETIEKYPTGANVKKVAEEVSLPLSQVKAMLLQLCLLHWFVLR